MSLLLTRSLDIRARSQELDHWTLRPSRYGALDAFMEGNGEQNSIVSDELLQKARSAVGRSVAVPVYDSETVSIGSTRSVTIADSENTSALYTVNFTTYAWGFTHAPALYLNNDKGNAEDFQRKFMKYYLQFLADLDTAALSTLSTNRSQVFADLLGIYTNTSNTVVAAQANKNEILGDLTTIMNANDFYGSQYKIIANAGVQSQVSKMAEYTEFNEKNQSIQWLDKTFGYTNRLANAASRVATGYAVNPGSLGMVFRHEREALLGTKLPDGTEWMETVLPGGIPIDMYFYYGVGDYNALAGAATADFTRGHKEHYGFAIEIAWVTAYNTDLTTYASPIVKFEIADT